MLHLYLPNETGPALHDTGLVSPGNCAGSIGDECGDPRFSTASYDQCPVGLPHSEPSWLQDWPVQSKIQCPSDEGCNVESKRTRQALRAKLRFGISKPVAQDVELLGTSSRHVRLMRTAFRLPGATALAHGNCGRHPYCAWPIAEPLTRPQGCRDASYPATTPATPCNQSILNRPTGWLIPIVFFRSQ